MTAVWCDMQQSYYYYWTINSQLFDEVFRIAIQSIKNARDSTSFSYCHSSEYNDIASDSARKYNIRLIKLLLHNQRIIISVIRLNKLKLRRIYC